MNISPISDKRKSELISDFIVEQIKSNAWLAKQKIPSEFDLASQFNVSRTSVRHAISQLVGQGILTTKHGEGTYVNEVLPDGFFGNLRQLFIMETPAYLEVQEFRKIIEPSITFYAALKARAEDVEALGSSVKNQMECVRKNDMKAYALEDQHFHMLLAISTKNSMVIKTISILGEMMNLAMEHTTAITGYTNGVEFHTQIFEHIKNREPEKASMVMQQHIENNIRAALERQDKIM